jgi:hypothetical protein
MEVSSQHHDPATLSRGKNSPWYPFDRRLCWPKNRTQSYGEDKILAPAWNRTSGVHPIAVVTKLFWCLWLTAMKHDFDSSEGVFTLPQQYVVLPPIHHPHFRVFLHLILFRWSQVYKLTLSFLLWRYCNGPLPFNGRRPCIRGNECRHCNRDNRYALWLGRSVSALVNPE